MSGKRLFALDMAFLSTWLCPLHWPTPPPPCRGTLIIACDSTWTIFFFLYHVFVGTHIGRGGYCQDWDPLEYFGHVSFLLEASMVMWPWRLWVMLGVFTPCNKGGFPCRRLGLAKCNAIKASQGDDFDGWECLLQFTWITHKGPFTWLEGRKDPFPAPSASKLLFVCWRSLTNLKGLWL